MKPKITIGPILALMLPLVLMCLTALAWAHQAPEGWSYDAQCCSGEDCAQVIDDASIRATPTGWLIGETGEVIGYSGDDRLRHSQDEHFHRCVIQHGSGIGKTRCLYVPGMGT